MSAKAYHVPKMSVALFWICSATCMFCAERSFAVQFHAKAAMTGDWAQASTWLNGAVPDEGSDVVITNAGAVVIISSPSSNLNSLAVGSTLTFTNWTSVLTALDVLVASGGTITLPAAFTNNVMSNRIWLACSNLHVESGGQINADGRGWAGADGYYTNGNGPGGGFGYGGQNYCAGGGYGGRGGWGYYVGMGHMGYFRQGGVSYGSDLDPTGPGSGGGGTPLTVVGGSPGDKGGNGGGAILIQASGTVVINGLVSANGSAGQGSYAGGGSGGSISITCRVFAATGGIIRANGGNPAYSGNGGAGGGGRIAVKFDAAAQGALPKPVVRFLTKPGTGYTESYYGWGFPAGADLGTLTLSDYNILDPAAMTHVAQLSVVGGTTWAVDTLLVTDAWVRIAADGLSLTVTNDLMVVGGGATMNNTLLEFGRSLTNNEAPVWERNIHNRYGLHCFSAGPTLNIGNNLILTNNGALYLGFGDTNLDGKDYEALISVGNVLGTGTNGWLYPYCNPTNGLAPLIRAGSVQIASPNSGISADGRGYGGGGGADAHTNGYGGGGGGGLGYQHYCAGGGYGGAGGNASSGAQGGPACGSSNVPSLPGAGGGGTYPLDFDGYPPGSWGGAGGGLIRLQATRQEGVKVDGILSANGGVGGGIYYGGGGAGGAIWIDCVFLRGTGIIRANGGMPRAGSGGGGGGGRIAIRRPPTHDLYAGAFEVLPASGYANAGTGTVVFIDAPLAGAMFVVK